MREMSYRSALVLASLPTATTALAGVTVRLSADNRPYWCDGSSWIDLAAGGSSAPGGSDLSVQIKLGSGFAGAANVSIHDGDLHLASNTPSVSAPSADGSKLFGRLFGGTGGRAMPAAISASGSSYVLQPSFLQKNIALWKPPGNATTAPGVFGIAAPTAGGTATARSVAVTNTLTRARRLGYASSTTAATYGGHYVAAAQYTLGTGTGLGGFLYSCRFGVSDAAIQAVARTFVGLSSSVAAPTNVSPTTLTNAIGIGAAENDTVWRIYYGGSAAQTPISLGANFPVNTTDLIELTLWSPPNQNGVVFYDVTRFITNNPFTFNASGVLGPGTAGTTLPANTTLLAHRAWRNNNTAAAAVAMDIASVYIETDW